MVDPALPALIHGERSVGWGEFDRRTDALAAAFLAGGAVAGDKVAHLMRNGPAYLETTVAAFKARLVHVNVNYRYTGEELFYILDNSDAAVLVFDAEFAPLVATLLPRLPALRQALQVGGTPAGGVQDFAAAAASAATLPPQDHAADDMLFIYTGGTTGVPKGVMWDQSAIWSLCGGGAPALGSAVPMTLDDHLAQVARGEGRTRALVMPPLMHGSGFLIAIYTLARGGTVITLPAQSFEAAEALAACERHAPDYSVIVGDAFARPLLRSPRRRRRQHRVDPGDDLERYDVVARGQGRSAPPQPRADDRRRAEFVGKHRHGCFGAHLGQPRRADALRL